MSEPFEVQGHEAQFRGRRLDSWKEIAAYLNRDIRTAQRWEKFEGLPVHRHRHDERGTAYAYAGEIERWLEARTLRSRTNEAGSDNGAAKTRPQTRHYASLIVGLLVVALGSAAFARWWDPATHPKLTTLSVVFPADETFQDWGPDIALSPDGETIAYKGWGPLKLRRLDQLDAKTVAHPGTTALMPFFSPDGGSIGFLGRGKLLRAPVGAGVPEAITSVDLDFVGVADWGAHGEIVHTEPEPNGSHRLFRVPAGGGRPSEIAVLDGHGETAYWLTPQWVDGGRHILATVQHGTAVSTTFQAVLVSAATGASRTLLDDARHARLIDDVLVYWRNDTLFAVKFDLDNLQPRGPHVIAWEGVGSRVRNRSWAAAADTLVYWPRVRSLTPIVWVERDGTKEGPILPPARYWAPRLSPDGRRLLVARSDLGSTDYGDIWQHDFASGTTVRLTHGNRSRVAAWAPDGAHIVVAMKQGSSIELFRLRADGAGEPEPLGPRGFLAGIDKQPIGWAGEHTLLVYQDGTREQAAFWMVPLQGTTAPRPILQDRTAGSGAVSPDGRWLAYSSALGSGQSGIRVARLPEGQPTWTISTDGGRRPLWSKTGRELFYMRHNSVMAVVATVNGNTFTPGVSRQLFDSDIFQSNLGEPHYDVTHEGRFLIVQRGRADGPERLNVVQGWFSEVERRLRAAQ